MKLMLVLVCWLVMVVQSIALPACRCTTNTISIPLFSAAPSGAWSIPSGSVYIGTVTFTVTNCICPAGLLSWNNPPWPPPPVFPMFTNPVSPRPALPLINITNAFNIMDAGIVDPACSSSPNVYFKLVPILFDHSTNLAGPWQSVYSITNWISLDSCQSVYYSNGVPQLTNTVMNGSSNWPMMKMSVGNAQALFIRIH